MNLINRGVNKCSDKENNDLNTSLRKMNLNKMMIGDTTVQKVDTLNKIVQNEGEESIA